MSSSNKFIVLEGLDCSGKTTLAKALAHHMQPCTLFTFPDRTSRTGTVIDRFLRRDEGTGRATGSHELHLLYSANRYEKAALIREAIKHGNVVCDRYWYSGAAYSVAKGLDYDWCVATDSLLPVPSHVFFLDVDSQTVAKRSRFGQEAHDKIEFQAKVYNIYQKMVSDKLMVAIDGSHSPEETLEDVISKLK